MPSFRNAPKTSNPRGGPLLALGAIQGLDLIGHATLPLDEMRAGRSLRPRSLEQRVQRPAEQRNGDEVGIHLKHLNTGEVSAAQVSQSPAAERRCPIEAPIAAVRPLQGGFQVSLSLQC